MNLEVKQGRIQESDTDTVIVTLFEGSAPSGATEAVNQALKGAIGALIAQGDFRGKANETAVLYPQGAIPAKRVIVVGLGKEEDFTLDAARQAAGTAVTKARDLNGQHVAIVNHGVGEAGAQATGEGVLLALYRYDAAKRYPEPLKNLASVTFVEADAAQVTAVQTGVATAQAIAAGVTVARDLVNMPPNVATPTKMADVATEIAKAHHLTLHVGGREWAEKHHMGGFLSVAQGAGEPPQFIILEHNSQRTDLDTIVLVGKGVTFDTGGISLKPSADMDDMKADMGGAAAVLGAMKTIALLNLPLRIIGITPCTENMPDAFAYRPADVITMSNGKTVEIISTDAEGRMILADALVYAERYNPKAVIDLATLTGACVIALGPVASGLFTVNDNLRDQLVAAGQTTQERVWPLPLWDDYKQAIKSEVADMKNSGGRFGGVGTSAIFLKEFTNYPWVHLDIAAMPGTKKPLPYIPVGATGFGVRLLVEFLRNWA